MSVILQVENLQVSLRGRSILKGLSFNLAQGEIVAVMGDNGSGKSTLLHAVLSLVPISGGRIVLFGEPLTWRNKNTLRRRIGFVPQILQFDDAMPISVREVIGMGRTARSSLGRRFSPTDHKLIDWAASTVGILPLLDRPIGRLSGGEKQKTQIARVLCQQPDLLLLDECFAHLSATAQQEGLVLLDNLSARNNFAILLVTHDIQAIPNKCKRVLGMENGRLVFDGSLTDLQKNFHHKIRVHV